jgi:SAM-dependent methyltransferase
MQDTYVDTFFRELSPVWLNYVAALGGAVPISLDREFRYLELGCGFATSTVVNAAALPAGRFVACDINPLHIERARRHATALGCDNVQLLAESFDAVALYELPAFDFIVLHGVYSWVDASARTAIRRIIDANLKPGGLAYVSYNCHPGWSAEIPLRRFLQELAEHDTEPTSAVAAVESLEQLAPHLRYVRATPEAASAIAAYTHSPANYLAHEFLSSAWQVFYSVDVLDELAMMGLAHLGSATLPDNHPPLLIDEPTQNAIAALRSPTAQQLAFDFAVNRRFRRDLFVRATPRAAIVERHLDAVIVGCATPPSQLAARVRVPRGEIGFQPDFIAALAALLECGPTTFANAVAQLATGGGQRAEIARNLVYLLAAGALRPFACRTATATEPGADSLLERALGWAMEHGRDAVIPSPVAGSGVVLPASEARALHSWLAAGKSGSPPPCSADLRGLGLID